MLNPCKVILDDAAIVFGQKAHVMLCPDEGVLELEQIVERFSRVVVSRGGRFALDGRSRREKCAPVARALRRHAFRDRLCALESAARVEGDALRARVQLGAASAASIVEPDVTPCQISALGTSHHVAEPGHVDVPGAILGDSARPGGSTRFGRRARRGRSWRPVTVTVLITSLAVLPVTH
jgi:hypothetical protein